MSSRLGSCLKDYFISEFLEYETPKIVTIRSRFIGILNKLVQITIILYLIIWVFIFNHGYQYIDKAAISAVTTKVKGVSYTNSSDVRIGTRVWDTADLIVPPQENGALFITTNVIVTHNQTQGECAEEEWTKSDCKTDFDCLPVGKPYHLGHGVSTGRCDNSTGTCIVRAWCPREVDSLPSNGQEAMIDDAKDFTVFIKNHVHFPYYQRARSSLIESIDKAYLRQCNYHPTDDPYCPIFRVGDMVSLSEAPTEPISDSHFDKMAVKGGVITIGITWDCNFDHPESECKPSYKFDRLDNFQGNTIANGYNFRYPINFQEQGEMKRHLVKAFGILFMITTQAQARKFNIITFLQNLGSGLALLGLASVCCDLFLLYLHRKKNYFKDHIFQQVERSPSQNTDASSSFLKLFDTKKPDKNGDCQNDAMMKSKSDASEMEKMVGDEPTQIQVQDRDEL